MESKTLTLPISQNDEYGYELAYRLAGEQLAQIDDIEEQCRKSGTQYLDSQKAIVIEYLNQQYLITLVNIRVSLMDKEEEVPLLDKILLLHYFIQAKGTPISNQLISFKELPEGAGYFPTFYQRAIKPLVTYFGNEPHRLIDMARLLNGHEADYGDASVTINALSRVPLTLVLWQGDAEFPPEGSIMFDRTISDYLPTEDIIFLCQTTAWRLVKLLKSAGKL
ncbi:MAG: DUF3786 domain-containing protein [Dehalococcoidales bacterium]